PLPPTARVGNARWNARKPSASLAAWPCGLSSDRQKRRPGAGGAADTGRKGRDRLAQGQRADAGAVLEIAQARVGRSHPRRRAARTRIETANKNNKAVMTALCAMSETELIVYQFSRMKIEQVDFAHFLSLYTPKNLPAGPRLKAMLGRMLFC